MNCSRCGVVSCRGIDTAGSGWCDVKYRWLVCIGRGSGLLLLVPRVFDAVLYSVSNSSTSTYLDGDAFPHEFFQFGIQELGQFFGA